MLHPPKRILLYCIAKHGSIRTNSKLHTVISRYLARGVQVEIVQGMYGLHSKLKAKLQMSFLTEQLFCNKSHRRLRFKTSHSPARFSHSVLLRSHRAPKYQARIRVSSAFTPCADLPMLSVSRLLNCLALMSSLIANIAQSLRRDIAAFPSTLDPKGRSRRPPPTAAPETLPLIICSLYGVQTFSVLISERTEQEDYTHRPPDSKCSGSRLQHTSVNIQDIVSFRPCFV